MEIPARGRPERRRGLGRHHGQRRNRCSLVPQAILRWRAYPAGSLLDAGSRQGWLFPRSGRPGKHIVVVAWVESSTDSSPGEGLRRSFKNLLEESVSRFCSGIRELCASRSPAIPECTPGSPGFSPAPTDFPPAIPVGAELSPGKVGSTCLKLVFPPLFLLLPLLFPL
jgi:hypothetical protein